MGSDIIKCVFDLMKFPHVSIPAPEDTRREQQHTRRAYGSWTDESLQFAIEAVDNGEK